MLVWLSGVGLVWLIGVGFVWLSGVGLVWLSGVGLVWLSGVGLLSILFSHLMHKNYIRCKLHSSKHVILLNFAILNISP